MTSIAARDHGFLFARMVATELRIAAFSVGHRTVLRLSGEIDFASAPAVSDAIEEALAAGAAELWVDLERVDFMDSSGVHALTRAAHAIHELNRRFAIICPAGPVLRVLEISGACASLPVYADRAAAHLAA